MSRPPNVVFVFADQWRQAATGYAGNTDVITPNLDALARESVNFISALSGCPVCCPYRASLLTGQRPLTHGVFLNDVALHPQEMSIAQAFAAAGYHTAYIGKWHLNGQGRSRPIPPERRLGFHHWQALECTHDYQHSAYYENDSTEMRHWSGYDAIAQTRDAEAYLRSREERGPFLLMLSWGPPHPPYETAPPEFRALYNPARIQLRPNVPAPLAADAQQWLAGYYAHCSALDSCVGSLLATLRECELERDTIFIFTSDHGDMLGSHGEVQKQRPWDESVRVPFLLRYPGLSGWRPRECDALIDAPDIMPTLLGLSGIPIPDSVEGIDFAGMIAGGPDPSDGAALLTCPHPFGQWPTRRGGREYRGLRTRYHTYVRDRNGPWLLYDNEADPYQMHNLVGAPGVSGLQSQLDSQLDEKLTQSGDDFSPGSTYVKKWNYAVDANGTVPFQS